MIKYHDILNAAEPKVLFLKCVKHVIEDADYRSMSGLNQSYLKKVYTHGVIHAENQRLNPMEKTPALVMGSLFHTLVLEENEFTARYAVLPDIDRRTKEGKIIYSEFEQASGGRDLVKEADVSMAMRMRSPTSPTP
jgi:exodeoxyribonuclease VIII